MRRLRDCRSCDESVSMGTDKCPYCGCIDPWGAPTMSKHEEMARVAPLDFIASIRGTASFLRANFTDLSISEMEVIAKCLDDCAAALSRIEQETEARVLEVCREVAAKLEDTAEYLTCGDDEDYAEAQAVRALIETLSSLSTKNLPTSPKSVEGWRSANEPPAGPPDTWTRDVVALTNYGDVFMLAYYHGKDGGTWQRPARFNKGEEVAWWIAQPIQASPDTDLSVSGEVIGGCPRCGQKHDGSVDDIEPIL